MNSISKHCIHLPLRNPIHHIEATTRSQQQPPAQLPTPSAGIKKRFSLGVQEQEHPLWEETQNQTDTPVIATALMTVLGCISS